MNLLKRRRPQQCMFILTTSSSATYPQAPSPSSSAFSFVLPYVDASLPDQADHGDNNDTVSPRPRRRVLFLPFPMRKHFRSGESIVHHPIIPPSALVVRPGVVVRAWS